MSCDIAVEIIVLAQIVVVLYCTVLKSTVFLAVVTDKAQGTLVTIHSVKSYR